MVTFEDESHGVEVRLKVIYYLILMLIQFILGRGIKK